MRLHRIVIAGALALAACSAKQPQKPPDDHAAPSESADDSEVVPENHSSNPTEAVPLKIVMTDQTTDGGVMTLRVRIENPLSQPVKGVRVQFVIVAPSEGDKAKVLDIQQKEMDASIPPGGSAVLTWDVESAYLGTQSGHFLLAAYPKRLGDKDMPPPDNWKE